MRVSVEEGVVQTAESLSKVTVPAMRSGGFPDAEDQERGYGDMVELVANLTLFLQLSRLGIPTGVNIQANRGDDYDLSVFETTWNTKASLWQPYRNTGLHLFAKQEDTNKPITGFIQVFVHLDEEEDDDPHVHVAGIASLAKVNRYPVQAIPKTGYPGYAVPNEELTSWEVFIERSLSRLGQKTGTPPAENRFA